MSPGLLEPTITIVTRTQPGREELLSNALFSLAAQQRRPDEVRVVVHLQGDEDLSALTELMELWRGHLPGLVLLENRFEGDGRTRSLNIGVTDLTSRFVGFLDDDDVLYPRHLRILSEALLEGTQAWAYANTVLATYASRPDGGDQLEKRSRRYTRDRYSFLQHLKTNFIPFHSLLIDRSRSDDELRFDESYLRCEDYEMLLRLARTKEPLHLPEETCEYRVRMDGSNSTVFESSVLTREQLFEKRWEWLKSEHQLEQFKIDLVGWWVEELLELVPSDDPELLAEAQRIVDELWAARSWRLTAPIRWASSLLRFQRPPRRPEVTTLEQAMVVREQVMASSSWRLGQQLGRLLP